MNRLLLPFAALAVGLLPVFAEANVSVDIARIAQSAGESLPGIVPTMNIATPEGIPMKMESPFRPAWGVIVDRKPQTMGIIAAPCERRPTRAIVCSLDETINLSDLRVPAMLGAGLNLLLARETRMSGPTFRPAHQYTTRNGRSEFSCFHKTVRKNCRWVPGTITERMECDEVEAPGHDCTCTSGCY